MADAPVEEVDIEAAAGAEVEVLDTDVKVASSEPVWAVGVEAVVDTLALAVESLRVDIAAGAAAGAGVEVGSSD